MCEAAERLYINLLLNHFLHLFELGLLIIVELAELSLDRFYHLELLSKVKDLLLIAVFSRVHDGLPAQTLPQEKTDVAQNAPQQLLG